MHMHAFRERDYHSPAMAFFWKGRNLLDRVSFDLALTLRASPKAFPYLLPQNLYLRILIKDTLQKSSSSYLIPYISSRFGKVKLRVDLALSPTISFLYLTSD